MLALMRVGFGHAIDDGAPFLLAVIILFSVLSASSLVPALLTKDVAMEINRSNDELLPSLRLIASMEKAIVALREEEANILLDSMSPSTASDNGNSSADRLAEAATALQATSCSDA